jgi:hypothetical protein
MPSPENLRQNIDKGRSGDKVRMPDPAAAPLGTDDEAGGAPATAEEVELARRNEVGRDLGQAPHDTNEHKRGIAGREGSGRTVPTPVILIGVLVLLAILAFLLNR